MPPGIGGIAGFWLIAFLGSKDIIDLVALLNPCGMKQRYGLPCPTCGMTYDDFRKVGRLGCSDCYVTFKRSLGGLLKRIHGSPIHLGKSPARLVKPPKGKTELAELKRKLERAIEEEEFEEAARFRDQIRHIEQQEPMTRRKGR